SIVAQRYDVDFSGRVTLPESFVAEAGKIYKFKLRTTDYGVNITDSAAVDLTVQADTEAPSISISSPPATVYDRQALQAAVSISDNVGVASYKVYLLGHDDTPLVQKSGLNQKSVTADKINIDLSQFDPLPANGASFTFVVEATDTSGNPSKQSKVVQVMPDNAPVLGLIDANPASTLVQGGLLYSTLHIADDYESSNDLMRYFPLYTTLRGLGMDHGRNPIGNVDASDPSNPIPYISFDYPEAAGQDSAINIGGTPYISAAGGKLKVYPRPANLGRFRIDFGAGMTVSYRVRRYSNKTCTALVSDTTITDPAGVDLASLLTDDVTVVLITPQVTDSQGQSVNTYVKSIRVDAHDLDNSTGYTVNGHQRSIGQQIEFSVELADDYQGANTTGYVIAPTEATAGNNLVDRSFAIHVPTGYDQRAMSVLGYAADRFSDTRGPITLTSLAAFTISPDQTPPVLTVESPLTGATVVPVQRVMLHLHATDNTGGLRSIQLLDGSGTIVREVGGIYGQQDFVIPYDVPRDLDTGELDLSVVAVDDTGTTATRTLAYPIGPNAPPQITVTKFSTYKLNGVYKTVITTADRLNYGEFWVRSGEPFRLDTQLDDDAGLASYTINRIDDAGNRIVEYSQTFHSDCPNPQILMAQAGAELVFKQAEDTQYEIVLTDTYGNKTVRSFLVHPLSNMAPDVRITSPAQGQTVVAGTFQIKVGVVATDDRQLDANAVTVYADGVPLAMINPNAVLRGTSDIGGAGAIQQGFAAMYDDIEKTYGVDMANSYGRADSPYAVQEGFILAVPAGLVRYGEPLKLTAVVHDADGSVGRHEITIDVAQDTINPVVAITRPDPGFGPTEASDFTLGFEGYDNVKVAKLEVSTAYGVMTASGDYVTTPYGAPIRSIDSIDSRDFNPVTTLNIDTPEYLQTVHVDKLTDIMSRFTDLSLTGSEPYDIWIKLVAYDAAGNTSEREVSFPVHIDQRPTMDFLTPVQGAKIVEGAPLSVNLKAFDDVGIDSVRLIATHGSANDQVFNLALRQPPYSFQVSAPAYDSANAANNLLTLNAEAIDTYGAAYGDLDKHTADETLSLQIVQDQPPSVLIAQPKDGDDVIEGQHMLVQVNANDDVGIDRVVLQVSGLAGGDRVFTDTSYPYEFLVDIPYGQAGQDISLTASAVEKRYSGTPRVATTPTPLHVHVQKDTQPPTLTVTQPAASGTTVVEKRSLPFSVEATDNVAVSTVSFVLSADLNGDGQFTPDEVVAQQTLLTAPYAGSIAMKAISDYLGANATGVNQLNMQLTVRARDGAGNESVITRPVTLVRNQPPSVDGIQILDSQGYSLGSAVSQITEGRDIVVQVLAHDPEVGVDSVRLFQATDPKSDDDYKSVGVDNAAPFQFHLTVPPGSAGSVLSFKAQATDVDGYVSTLSEPLNLTVVPDQPPTAKIVKPDNDQSVIIDGQDLEVWVQADDDLGPDGIDRVVFSVNGTPVTTVYDSLSKQTGSANQEDIYKAVITPPQGASGFVVQATAYDVAGHATQTQEVRIGTVADTVAPKISVLGPLQGDVLTAGATVHAVVEVDDIGADSNRQVYLHWIREYQDGTGAWQTLATSDQQLLRDDTRAPGDTTPVSDPDNNRYIYWGDFADGNILTRGAGQNERVRVVAEVKTPNHDVTNVTTHEVGLPVSERRFLLPTKPAGSTPSSGERAAAQSVYYTAVSQFQSDTQTGALLGAWSNVDPMRLEQGLGNALENDTTAGPGATYPQPRTGLFIADDTNDAYTNGVEHYVYSDLLAGSSEVFSGTISEIAADSNFVLAAKSGVLPGTQLGSDGGGFAGSLINEINKNPDSGKTYLDDTGGELLVFTVHNGDNQFGLPYLLKGRIDLPYPDVYGLARKDNLAFVANGYGGVQVIDISNLAAPYRVGFIKPDDLARDVKIKDHFAYIAASHQG
ncbi:MAG: Ig-like domain-containing protein, partial [Gammaproteobacteria bacterium]